ncbi:hypothetical protein ICW40_19205, partial [Actinotalea ferrariae]|nr:hypothetical protein [Actinotalea ferrariae]
GPDRDALVRAAIHAPAPGAVLAVGDASAASDVIAPGGTAVGDPPTGDVAADAGGAAGARGGAAAPVPLLADRPTLDGRPTAYVCRGFVCHRPTTDPSELTTQLTP